MIKIKLEQKLFTHNEMKRWANAPHGKGWAMYAAWKKQLKEMIFVEVASYCNTGPPRSKKGVQILYLTKVLQDKDNFYASLKPVLDSLTELELIKDDSEKWIHLLATQRVDREKAYLLIIKVV